MARRVYLTLSAIGITLALISGASIASPLLNAGGGDRVTQADSLTSATSMPPSSVSVNGSGLVNLPPDMATVTFGVLADQLSAQDAQDQANRVIAAAVNNLHALGIPDRHIQTQDISLSPRYDNGGNVIGYQASQTLAVQVYSLAMVGRAVDAGVSAHANNNVSISFGLRDENAARLAALKLAVGVARARADAAAAALGRSLNGAHVQFTENGQQVYQHLPYAANLKAAQSAAAPTQAFGGTLTIEEDVTLTYTF